MFKVPGSGIFCQADIPYLSAWQLELAGWHNRMIKNSLLVSVLEIHSIVLAKVFVEYSEL